MRHFNRSSGDYHFIDKIEAGLVLTGSEAKSLRAQGAQFQAAQILVNNGRPLLVGLHIPLYKYSRGQEFDPLATRSLLLSAPQIKKLQSAKKQKYMLIPIAIYLQGKWFKLEIGIGRKLKKYEKRAQLKAKEFKSHSSVDY